MPLRAWAEVKVEFLSDANGTEVEIDGSLADRQQEGALGSLEQVRVVAVMTKSSFSSMVIVALDGEPSETLLGLLSVRVRFSLLSTMAASRMGTSNVWLVCPGRKVAMPLTAVLSLP